MALLNIDLKHISGIHSAVGRDRCRPHQFTALRNGLGHARP